MTTSFFNGESTFPENNTTDQLVDALQQQLTASTADSQAAQAAAVSAAASASNAAIAEENVAGLSQAANDTLAQANDALTAANAAISSTAASAAAAASSATAAAASATTSGTAAGQASVSETNAAASAASALASKNASATSETNSAASATAANTSKVNAGTSETNAAASATSASTSKNAAATSAGNAATSESNALSSKNAAATSAANAATSESNALTSQNAAAASALVAQNFTASLAGKNRIINPEGNVSQRGTSVIAATTAGTQVLTYGGPDRWRLVNGAGGSVQQDQTPFTYNGVSRQAIRQVAVSPIVDMTGANTWQGLTQIIEGVHCYDLIGQPIAVSFLFMASVSGTFSCALRTTQGTVYSYVANFSAVSGVPKKVTVLIPAIPAGATIANGTGNGLILHIGGLQSGSNMCPTGSLNAWQASQYYCGQGFTNWGAGANNWISASEVQLEAGSVATPYERRMFPMEFILCQRYYESGTCLIQLPAAASAIQNIKFATYKRAVPTMVTSNQNYSSASAMQSNGVYQDSFGMQLTASAASGYGSCGWAASCEL